MAETDETVWFRVVAFAAGGVFAGISIANVIYYQRLYNNKGGGGVSQNEALSMLIVNIIILIVALILFIWSLVRLLIPRRYRDEVSLHTQRAARAAYYGIVQRPYSNA